VFILELPIVNKIDLYNELIKYSIISTVCLKYESLVYHVSVTSIIGNFCFDSCKQYFLLIIIQNYLFIYNY